MKEFKYVLKDKLDDGMKNPYKGNVLLRLLPFMERNEASREFNFELDDEKNVKSKDLFELNQKMATLVKNNIVTIDVKKGKESFSSLDELDYDEDVAHLYGELGGVLIKGINLGKN